VKKAFFIWSNVSLLHQPAIAGHEKMSEF